MRNGELGSLFDREFGRNWEVSVAAPGRVNLIGEHTDYNDGFVFPAAIDRFIQILAARRDDSLVRAYSADFEERSEFTLDRLEKSEAEPWSNYVRGVAQLYQKRGYELGGVDLVISGNVPLGAGLSSSAAFEVAVAESFRVLFELKISKVDLALLCQAAEGEFVGVQCGIMDQFVCTLAEAGTALFLDCRDLSYSAVPLSREVAVVVCNSKVQRTLGSSEYNKRRAECEGAVARLNGPLGAVRALRDVDPEELEAHKGLLTELQHRRARHVVSENDRVTRGVEALKGGDLETFGQLLNQSHLSLRDDYEVSCKELDLLVELAQKVPGTLGARMTGAGFGGCTVNLVRHESVEEFCATVGSAYRGLAGREAEIYVTIPSNGVSSSKTGS